MRPSPLAQGLSVAFALVAAVWPFAGRAQERVWLHSYDGHGQPFDLQQLRGHVVAVTFASRHTRDEAEEVNDTLRQHGVDVVTLVDFRDIPPFGKGAAKKQMAQHDEPGQINLVDERGRLAQAFNTAPKERVTILMIDREGVLRGRYDGLGQLPQALQEAERLKGGAESARP
jgi:hypothetical protein